MAERVGPRPRPCRDVPGVSEGLIGPTASPPGGAPPGTPPGFVSHPPRPVRGLVAALSAGGSMTAAFDALVPVFTGRVVGVAATADPRTPPRDAGGQLAP